MKSKFQVDVERGYNRPLTIIRSKQKQRYCLLRSDDLKVELLQERMNRMPVGQMKYRRKQQRDYILSNNWNFILGGDCGRLVDRNLWKRSVQTRLTSSNSLDLRRALKRIRNHFTS